MTGAGSERRPHEADPPSQIQVCAETKPISSEEAKENDISAVVVGYLNLLCSMTLCVGYDVMRAGFHAAPRTGRELADNSIIAMLREGRHYGAKISGKRSEDGKAHYVSVPSRVRGS